MPPPRLVFFLTAAIGFPTILTFFSLIHSHPSGSLASEDESRGGIRSFFSFHTPSTLFPPSAIISLTDDNSTFFLARPADFGPNLASKGLSGPLWIGSGFGEDDTGRGGAEGELGCSDVPGWEDSFPVSIGTKADEKDKLDLSAADQAPKISRSDGSEAKPAHGDGTDDILHHPLPSSPVSRQSESGQADSHEADSAGHADIQSLQESAEISGKIALVSRGGCGFLEKVKWAQRRGAKALIVGDHTRGGALVTMYARGDTSNISIPSVFTSHTTAQLLSTLIPAQDEDGHDLVSTTQGKAKDGKPALASDHTKAITSMRHRRPDSKLPNERDEKKSTWTSSIAYVFGMGQRDADKALHSDSRRPPSSGRLGGLAEKAKAEHFKSTETATKTQLGARSTSTSSDLRRSGAGDDFVIGEQDWRDPDLVIPKSSNTKSTTTTIPTSAATKMSNAKTGKEGGGSDQQINAALTGGSITPGSGEYSKPGTRAEQQAKIDKDLRKGDGSSHRATDHKNQGSKEEHEGLWVTLTPTTMSTSPFFDTLLVLVVSPLVTLTVVYALLLLRSRIRRRRWRAPKSVVERLPIRTYHTMSSSNASSTRLASPDASSPTTPLLRSSPRSLINGARPRSATATGIGEAVSASLDRATAQASLTQNEKSTTITPKKRKKYHGRQVECVVCLEEYVDGHSRVMSLPCGHEFHAECM